jgi:ribosomal protein L37E
VKTKKIPQYRLDYIDLKLEGFKNQLKLTDSPIDCVVLLKKIEELGKYPVQVMYTDGIYNGLDAAAIYIKNLDCYQILLNRHKVRYPYQGSSDRRLNFTIAHEIGHILLEHLLIPNNIKNEQDHDMEELEADEFAARLLMPRKLICSCNYYSLDVVSSYMNVSKTALKVRLCKLGRTDIVASRKVKSCSRCGNIRFSAMAQYCGVCGQFICRESKGIRRIYYPDEVKMDSFKRALVCPKCLRDISHIRGDKCTYCKTYMFNFCSEFLNNSAHECSYANPGYARYCEMCGRPTYYYKRSYLADWQTVKCSV